jgi:peptidoglycan L-alanyl-D-glutamate endopeptidase CwlK
MTPRDEARLVGVHPALIEAIDRVLTAMSILGYPMGVTDGVRTLVEQQALYAQGRKQFNGAWKVVEPLKIVTNCDGLLKPSNHQVKADGLGHAVDCAFLKDLNHDGEPDEPLAFTWDEMRPWGLYGALAESQGMMWGGRWTSIIDRPHVELR